MNTKTTLRHFMLCFLLLFSASALYIGSTTAHAAWRKNDKCTLQSVTVTSQGKNYVIDGSLKPIEISGDTNWMEFMNDMQITSYTVIENDDCTDCYNNYLVGEYIANNDYHHLIYANGGDNHSITECYNDELDSQYIPDEYVDMAFKIKYNKDSSTQLNVRFIKSYTISYNLDGGTVSEELKTSYTAMDEITLPHPTKAGYTFTGWVSDDLTAATMDVVIAQGSYGNRSYTATYKSNSGNGGSSSVQPGTPSSPTKNDENKYSVGDVQVIGKASYSVTSVQGTPEVCYQAPANKKVKNVTIPNTVTLKDGCRAKVTSIANNAFKKCTKLKKITIPANISKIGKNAFKGCKNLKNITIKSTKLTKAKVGKNAFKGIHKKATIKVPKKKLKAYRKFLKTKGIGKKVKIKK